MRFPRLARPALAISAVLHVAAIVWMRCGANGAKPAAGAVQPAPRSNDVEVTLVEPPPSSPSADVAALPRPAHARRSNALTGKPRGDTTSHTPHAGHAALMAMRGPDLDTSHVDFPTTGSAPDEPATGEPQGQNAAPQGQEGEPPETGGVPGQMHHGTFTMTTEPDGTAHFQDDPNFQFHGMGGSFDLNDAFMREHGEDPYASEKLKVLDGTREQRFEQGKVYKHEQLAASGAIAYQNLEEMWIKARSLAERKQALFEMWDECAETGDPDLVAAGRAARQTIVAFIRARLKGPEAYTPEELARLNAQKTSATPFEPYA